MVQHGTYKTTKQRSRTQETEPTIRNEKRRLIRIAAVFPRNKTLSNGRGGEAKGQRKLHGLTARGRLFVVLRRLLPLGAVVRGVLDVHLEALLRIGDVPDDPDEPVRLDHPVLALDVVAVTRLLVRLGVAGVRVVYSVGVSVVGLRLKNGAGCLKCFCASCGCRLFDLVPI